MIHRLLTQILFESGPVLSLKPLLQSVQYLATHDRTRCLLLWLELLVILKVFIENTGKALMLIFKTCHLEVDISVSIITSYNLINSSSSRWLLIIVKNVNSISVYLNHLGLKGYSLTLVPYATNHPTDYL